MKRFINVLTLMLMGTMAQAQQHVGISEFVDGQQTYYSSVQIDATASRDAEKLARLAEKLLHTQGFIYVNEVAQQALNIDPNNRRAKLYKAIGEFIENTRGLYKRVLPLARSIDRKSAAGIAKAVDQLPLNLAQFMLDGPEDIHTASELQNLFLQMRSSIQKISSTVGDLESDLFFIRFYQLENTYSYYDRWRQEYVTRTSYSSGTANCPVDRITKNVYVFEPCKSPWFGTYAKSRLIGRKKFVDALDTEGLKLGVNAMNIYFSILTSTYDFTGLEKIAKKMVQTSKTQAMNSEDVIALFKAEPKFLTLKDKSIVNDMKLKGHEFVDSMKWYQKNFKDLCGSTLGEERDGHLLGPSACAVTGLNSMIYQVEEALSGPIEVRTSRALPRNNWWEPHREEHYDTEFDITAFLDGKLSNLQILMPDKFDRCGNPISLPDDSLGGLYPNADYTDYMRFTSPQFMTPVCN